METSPPPTWHIVCKTCGFVSEAWSYDEAYRCKKAHWNEMDRYHDVEIEDPVYPKEYVTVKMTITKAVVFQSRGPDIVFIHTELPHPFAAEVSTQPLCLKFEILSEGGVEYVRKNFGIEPSVIKE